MTDRERLMRLNQLLVDEGEHWDDLIASLRLLMQSLTDLQALLPSDDYHRVAGQVVRVGEAISTFLAGRRDQMELMRSSVVDSIDEERPPAQD